MTLSPLLFIPLLAEWLRLSNTRVWSALPWIGAASYQPWRHFAYLAILAAFILQLVGSIVSAFLFFRKRSSAPVVLVALLWLGWLVTLGLGLFDAALGLHNFSFIRVVGLSCRGFFFVGAWSLYMFASDRVKATFIRRRAVSLGQPQTVST